MNPTKAAVRAAEKIVTEVLKGFGISFNNSIYAKDVSSLAQIIDRETGIAELEAVANAARTVGNCVEKVHTSANGHIKYYSGHVPPEVLEVLNKALRAIEERKG